MGDRSILLLAVGVYLATLPTSQSRGELRPLMVLCSLGWTHPW
jgi:hypothetical protein